MPSSPSQPVADLHCDLLAYLVVGEMEKESRSIRDARSRVSLDQLREGNVALQTLAIFVMTAPGWTQIGGRQAEIFARLGDEYGDDLRPVQRVADLDADDRVGIVAAVENANAFAEEDEPLDRSFRRFDQMVAATGPLLYVSPTWTQNNRFGGGNLGDKGLTDDGRALLDFLADRGPAVDLSHACPRLAHDILDYTYKKGLDLPVLASHSPYAALVDIPRNLRDEAAQEIASRGGIIGLNFMHRYLDGEPPGCFAAQVAHARDLGILDAQVLGADFFYEGDIPDRPADAPDEFHADYGDASCYPRLLDDLRRELALDEEQIAAIAWNNFARFAPKVLPA